MSHPIEDYGIIGDTHTTALVSRTGSIDWLCWPRHDSPALFLRLLDDDKGGYCEIVFPDAARASRRYLPETNVLETTFTTASGRVVLTDFMPVSPPSTLPDEGPDGEGESRIVRHLRCEEGIVTGAFRTRPTFDYARRPAQAAEREDRSVEYRCRLDTVLVHAGGPIRLAGDVAVAAFELAAGEETFLVVSHDGAAHPDAEPSTLPDLDAVRARFDQTRRYWEAWSRKCTYRGRYRDAVLRSILCLKLLTYSPTGAIIAAASACLPEAVAGNRNYDYRFSWIRDASFTVVSFVHLGYVREASEYLRFLRESEPSRGRKISIYYPIDGDMPPSERLDHLAGWNGVGPLYLGNEAVGQTQNDIYGEFLMALHIWLEAVDYDPPERVNDHLPEVIANLAEAALAHRDQPDSGIWELRGEARHLLHSKAMVALALECAARIGRRIGLKDEAALQRWEDGAKSLRAEYQEQGWNEKRQAYTMGYGMDELDAAVLRVALFGAFDIADPRLKATMAAIDRELVTGDLVYRYRMDDGMTGDEGTFTPCAFWRVGCMALGGQTEEARELFERLLTRGNDLGLYAEEIDAATGAQRGNFPQAFTHMAIINHAVRLEQLMDEAETAAIGKLLEEE